jgi:hypothetical protein
MWGTIHDSEIGRSDLKEGHGSRLWDAELSSLMNVAKKLKPKLGMSEGSKAGIRKGWVGVQTGRQSLEENADASESADAALTRTFVCRAGVWRRMLGLNDW